MFEVGQLVFVKSISDRLYLGMITNSVLYLNSFEEAFYTIYLIDSSSVVTVPSQFVVPVVDPLSVHATITGSMFR